MTGDDCLRRFLNRMKNGRHNKVMADEIGIGLNTLYNWRRNPEGLKLYYLRLLVKTYHMRDAEILAIIRGEEEDV